VKVSKKNQSPTKAEEAISKEDDFKDLIKGKE
jgi:hypothetical protein